MGTEKAKAILDEALQRCQAPLSLAYKDWAREEVIELIIKVKTALNEPEEVKDIKGV